ncbi:hypothetical protein [Slackia exigua]
MDDTRRARATLSLNIPFRMKESARELAGYRASYTGDAAARSAYLDALEAEMAASARRGDFDGVTFEALRVVGGSPSIMNGDRLGRIVAAARRGLPLAHGCEACVEALPQTVCTASLTGWSQGGVDAVSLRVGSVHERELAAIGATYDADAVRNAVLFLDRFHVDTLEAVIVVGIPGQTPQSLRRTLRACVGFESKRIRIEPYRGAIIGSGALDETLAAHAADIDDASLLFDAARDFLAGQGFVHRSCDLFVRTGARSAFDDARLQGCDFFELGLDARTVADGFLCRSTSDYATYVECSTLPDAVFDRIVEEDDRARRLRFACCRLGALERVPLDAHDPDAEAFFASLESMGLAKRKDGCVSLTSAGMLLWPLIPQPMQG